MSKMGSTGSMFEADFLYRATDPRAIALNHSEATYQSTLERLRSEHSVHTERRSFSRRVQDLIAGEGCGYTEKEQSDPPSSLANDVHAHVVKMLDVEDYGYDRVRFLPCVNSTLDALGIDMIVVFTDPDTNKDYYISVDFSIDERKRKNQSYKADVLITSDGAEAQNINLLNYIEDIEDSSKQEDMLLRKKRREAMGEVIAAVIKDRVHSIQQMHEAHDSVPKRKKRRRRRLHSRM